MSSLYGLLVAKETVHQIPTYVVVVSAIMLLFAFCIGFAKGFRRVAWGGFYWMLTGVGFTFAYKYLAKVNPLASVMSGKLADVASFIWTIVLLILCVAVALILYAVCTMKFRPKEVLAPDPGVEIDEYGFEYEDEREDDCPYKEKPKYVIVGDCKPNFFGRLAGGFMCMVNVAVLLASIVAVCLLFISQTSLVSGAMGALFDVPLSRVALDYAVTYAFDFFTIGLVIWIAYKGYNMGFVGSLRMVVTTLGLLTIGDIAFALPFTKAAEFHFIARLIERCSGLYTGLSPKLCDILAKATAGALMAAVGFLLMLILSLILKRAVERIEEHMATLVIDEILAVILYLFVGALVIGTFWAILYILDYCGIFYVSEAFNDKAPLSKEIFEAAEHFLKDFADKSLLKYRAN